MADINAYSPKTGRIEVKEWMQYSPYFSFIVDGVAKITLSDEFWDDLAETRKLNCRLDGALR